MSDPSNQDQDVSGRAPERLESDSGTRSKKTMKAVRFHEYGGPDVLLYQDVPLPEPGVGQARVRMEYIGVNFIDTYQRTGLYPVPSLPGILGKEGAGVIDAIGPEVVGLKVGDRVCFWDAPGAYAQYVTHRADRLVPVASSMSTQTAAAIFLQGLTAHYLLRTIHRTGPDDRILIHAGAGGVGHLAIQMAHRFGARVAATCSTPLKAARLKTLGVECVIDTSHQDVEAAVSDWTAGSGVDVTLDGVGRATLEKSVRSTRVRGQVIFYGQASGEPDPIQPRRLLGSRTLTCATLGDYVQDSDELRARAKDLAAWVADGSVVPWIDQEFALEEARRAHQWIEGRRTIGKVLLVP